MVLQKIIYFGRTGFALLVGDVTQSCIRPLCKPSIYLCRLHMSPSFEVAGK